MTYDELTMQFLINRTLWCVSMGLLTSLIAARKGFLISLSGSFGAVSGAVFPPIALPLWLSALAQQRQKSRQLKKS